MSVFEISKIKDTALSPNLNKLSLKSYFVISNHDNVQDLAIETTQDGKIWLKAGLGETTRNMFYGRPAKTMSIA